jgi:hypothetical protein
MAFQSIVEDSRKMNAKMIAMGQSIDIQKMPRPKAGTQTAQRAAMYTPSGSDVEKMLYPKNFKERVYAPEVEQKVEAVSQQMVDEIREQTREPAKIIGDDDIITPVKVEAKSDNICSGPAWQRCRHFKEQGGRAFCKEYLSLCGKEKCSRARP